jgi:uncharacterized protein YegP (UPF0339 family)
MYYGRVDVYWPDGPIESYRLNKPTIAVGRSTGNDIVLDTTAISRYHITLTFNNHQVILQDLESVNGTYVDSVRLAANEPYMLRGGEEIQIGDIRLIFHPPTEETGVAEETTRRITLTQPTYRFELEGPDMPVAPGAHVQSILKIENLGDEIDRYFIEVDGLPKGWARVDRVEMELGPGEQGQALISFKPLRRSESAPGDYPFMVRVRSKSKPAQTVDAPTTLHVLPFSGFGMALGDTHVEAATGFKLYLHNQGNASLSLTLRGTDADHALTFQFPKSNLVLGPGERQTIVGTVRPRRSKVFGQEHEREFALVARAQDASGFMASIPGLYREKGILPAWTPVLAVPVLVFGLLLLAGALLLIFGNGDEDVQPTINAFTVSTPGVIVGESVQLAWDVVDAGVVNLMAENQDSRLQYPLEPGATTYVVTPDRTGLYRFVLEAHNGNAVTTAFVVVEVRPAVTLNLEVLDGTELVRNVRQDVRISWRVEGAREFDNGYQIQLDSAENGALLEAPLPAADYRDLQIVPQGEQVEWLVTLFAEGYDGMTASVTQKLPIVYPSCELGVDRTIVRSGPGEAYPAIVPPLESTPEGNLSLSPVARDPGGDWLQVAIGVDNPRPGWVPRADFVCANFDPELLVITIDFPPLPEPTPPPDDSDATQPAPASATPVVTSTPVGP